MADGCQSGLNNISKYPAPSINANIAQIPNEVSRMTMCNQNVFLKSATKTPTFDDNTKNISDVSSTNIFSNAGNNSQVAFLERDQQFATQLPNFVSLSTNSASCYFNKSTVSNVSDFTSDNIMSKERVISISVKCITIQLLFLIDVVL